jgi:hypothetical protein
MPEELIKILETLGPMLSGSAARHLQKAKGLTPQASRQRISRMAPPVCSLAGIRFRSNQRFIYLDSQFAKAIYLERLIEAFNEGSTSYANAVRAIENKGGKLPLSSWLSACGSPVVKLRGHLLASTILEKLTSCRVVAEAEDQRLGPIVQLCVGSVSSQRMWATSLAEEMILRMVSGWAKNLGFTSYGQQNIRTKGNTSPSFGGFAWDYTAPCFLHGIARYDAKANRPTAGFFVGDICLGKKLSQEDLGPFLAKLSVIRNRRGIRPFIPCYIASELEPGALKTLRGNNVIIGLLRNIFDKEVANLVEALILTLERAAAFAASNPEQIQKLLEGLAKLEGETLNVRGALFTLIVGHYFASQGAHIEINKEIFDSETGCRGEIDVVADESRARLTCVECKGMTAGALVRRSEVEHWVTDRVPLMRRYFLSQDAHKDKKMVFEFLTSSEFERDACEFLKGAKERTRKYEIRFFDRTGINDLLQTAKLSNISAILSQHYSGRGLVTSAKGLT